jgi:hypothetical protein
MTKAQFRNTLCILRSIDLYELQEVGLWNNIVPEEPYQTVGQPASKTTSYKGWASFRDDPYVFFIGCDDDTSDKIWSVMQRRSKHT